MKYQIKPTIHSRNKALKTILNKAIRAGLSSLPKQRLSAATYTVDVNLVSPKKIQQMNRMFLKHDTLTDVLSFPQFVPGSKPFERHIGDILICTAVAKRQAHKHVISCEEEIARLAIHGLFHLFGYDHAKAQEAKVMNGLETKAHSALRLLFPDSLNRIQPRRSPRGKVRR